MGMGVPGRWWRRTVLTGLSLALVVVGVLTLTPLDADLVPAVDRLRANRDQSASAAPLPGRRPVATIGVVSHNILGSLPVAKIRADLRREARNRDADIIGWQEVVRPRNQQQLKILARHGWKTAYFTDNRGTREVPISWRADKFQLLERTAWLMHHGAGPDRTTAPYPGRAVTSVLLRHRASGRTVRVLNTHVNQTIETGQRFEKNLNARMAKKHLRWLARHWPTLSGDVVVGTGDYNWDYRDDLAAKPKGGIGDAFAGRAVSSYEALGLSGVTPTRNTRWIDYVFVSKKSLDAGRSQFAAHQSLSGFHSDHRPLLAQVRLY